MSGKWSSRKFLTLVVGAVAVGGGCDITITPPPEAILQGVWELSNSEFGLSKRTLEFDGQGRLSRARTIIGAITLTDSDQHRLTRVNGSNVRIETSDNLIFEGTFNDTSTVITGKLTTEFEIPFTGIQVTVDNGDATLTKQ